MVATVAYVDLELAAQRVDDRDADAVQAAGDLVAAAAELAAGVQHGQRHRDGGHVLARGGVGGDAAAVVLDPDPAVLLQGHRDAGRSSRPATRRRSCRRSPRPGGAGRAHRSSRCTCPVACGPPRAPRAPGSRTRRTCPPRPRDPRRSEPVRLPPRPPLRRGGLWRSGRCLCWLTGGCWRASGRPRAILFRSAHITKADPGIGDATIGQYTPSEPDSEVAIHREGVSAIREGRFPAPQGRLDGCTGAVSSPCTGPGPADRLSGPSRASGPGPGPAHP